MDEFDINIDGKNYSDIREEFDTFGDVQEMDLNEQKCIEIEIIGLKSLSSFIGLDDTPIYYEDGKFFKVDGNKIVYTDITWEDIKGNIEDNPNIIEEIKKQSESISYEVVYKEISIHNNNINSHPYLQNKIQDNYNELNDKIDLNKFNTDEDIKKVNERVDKNDTQIEDLQSFTNDLRSDLDDLTVEVEVDIKGSITELDEKIDTLTQTESDHYRELDGRIEDLVEVVETNKTDSETRDTALGERIDATNTSLSAETQERKDEDKKLQDNIDVLTQTVSNNYTTLDSKIDGVDSRLTEVAEEINQTIEENVVALQQEDTALQNQINTHSQQITQEISDRQTADSNLQTQITANTTDISDLTQVVQDDYDELKDLIDKEVEDRENADTTLQTNINNEAKTRKDTDDSLQDQIDNLKARGRFLALWDATTGLAMSNPKTDKYQYVTGDYFIVGKVGETNYRPSGTEYVIGKASTEVESEELTVDDVYYFDNEQWRLQINHGKTVSFANLAGQPSDNTNLKNALDGKQDILVSSQNIKTINNQSILGSGNIEIQGASSFADLKGSPYDNKALADELNSLNIISLLTVYLRDNLGNDLLDLDGLKLTVRRT